MRFLKDIQRYRFLRRIFNNGTKDAEWEFFMKEIREAGDTPEDFDKVVDKCRQLSVYFATPR